MKPLVGPLSLKLVLQKERMGPKTMGNQLPSLHDAVCLNASYGEKKINGISLIKALKQDFPELDHADETHRLIKLLNRIGRPELPANYSR